MLKRLDGKTALITGGTAGLGRDMARLFAAEGAQVIITGRNADEGEKTLEMVRAAGSTGHFFAQDITSEDSWQQLFETIERNGGALDIAVLNAGAFFSKPIAETSIEDFDWLWSVNADAMFLGLKYCMLHMKAQKKAGSIISVSSLAGLIGINDCTAYCASKAAATQLAKVAAVEAAQFDPPVRVNSLNPGVIWSELITRSYGESDEVRAFVMDGNALQTVGMPDDVAEAALFLGSDDSSYTTGSAFVIDGGRGVD